MGLFCKSGFFSAVKHNQKKGTVHVRARFKGDLERLFTAHAVRAKVVETPNGDYRFRADVPGSVWRRVVAQVASSFWAEGEYNQARLLGHCARSVPLFVPSRSLTQKARGGVPIPRIPRPRPPLLPQALRGATINEKGEAESFPLLNLKVINIALTVMRYNLRQMI